jgi:acetyl esterase/lipase
LRDIPYATVHAAQRLDVYLPESPVPTPVVVFIHGGGWRGGSKNGVPGFLAAAVREGWLAVVSVEYRFTDVAIHPAQGNDCLRAIQFVRSKAQEWGIDATRLGVTGGSAGGHLSLWVALHDDVANPAAADPVERESSRVSCVVNFAGPTDWGLLSAMEHKHPAYRQLLGYAPGTPAADMSEALKTSVSPITYVSADDPPVLQVHGSADDIVPIEHARNLDARLRASKVDAELYVVEGGNHGVAGAANPGGVQRAIAFFRAHLKVPPPAAPAGGPR